MLSLAFHPDYRNNGFFFVYYTNGAGDLELARYKVNANPNVVDGKKKNRELACLDILQHRCYTAKLL